MVEISGDRTGREALEGIREELRTLAAAHRALERRLDRAQTAALRAVTWVAGICILLGFVLPAFEDQPTSDTDGDASSVSRLVQLPFYAFGPSAPGETSNGRVLNVVMGIGFTGLLVVAIGVIIALIASWNGLAEGWPQRIARASTVLLMIGTCVVLLIGVIGESRDGVIHWGTLVVLAVGSALAGLLLLTDVRRRAGAE